MIGKPIVSLKQVLRLVVVFLILIYLATRISLIGNIVHRIYGRSELRIDKAVDTIISPSGAQTWIQADLRVRNKGHAKADDVYVQVVMPEGRIARYTILTEEPYELRKDTADRLAISLDRLAPGASVVVRLFAVGSKSADLKCSAVSNEGLALDSQKPDSDEEVEKPIRFIADGFTLFWEDLMTRSGWQPNFERSEFTPLSTSLETTRFWRDILLLLMSSALCWLFLTREIGSFAIGVVTAVFSRLWFDYAMIGMVVVFILAAIASVELLSLLFSKQRGANVFVILTASAILIHLAAAPGGLHNVWDATPQVYLPLGFVVWVIITELAGLLWPEKVDNTVRSST